MLNDTIVRNIGGVKYIIDEEIAECGLAAKEKSHKKDRKRAKLFYVLKNLFLVFGIAMVVATIVVAILGSSVGSNIPAGVFIVCASIAILFLVATSFASSMAQFYNTLTLEEICTLSEIFMLFLKRGYDIVNITVHPDSYDTATVAIFYKTKGKAAKLKIATYNEINIVDDDTVIEPILDMSNEKYFVSKAQHIALAIKK